MIEKIMVPDIGENVVSGNVVGVLVSEGDLVEKDDGIIEFETEKAVVEIPSPAKGKIVEIRVKEGDELKIGDLIATLETAGEAADAPEELSPGQDDDTRPAGTIEKDQKIDLEPPPEHGTDVGKTIPLDERPVDNLSDRAPAGKKTLQTGKDDSLQIRKETIPAPAAPSVRRLARELGVDIHAVEGSGPGGRISEKDIKNHIQNTCSSGLKPRADFPTDASADPDLPDFTRWGRVETQDITTVRRITAESMTRSWRTVPQVTQFDRADISRIEKWIKTVNHKTATSGGKLTVSAILLKVIAEGLKQFPRFNASLDMQKQQIIFKQYIHVGIAVDTERGLLVPVIRDVDHKSIKEISLEIVDLADRARHKRLQPDQMEGGTFTLSNQGGIGGTYFTPIVYWPQAAILGVGRAATEALTIDEKWVPATMLPLALSYDHRINDGADAARFLRWVCEALEQPLNMHL
jgi:pyruvate dehydrogenase E2 component (dihydrolipoamide acetyltransferase)